MKPSLVLTAWTWVVFVLTVFLWLFSLRLIKNHAKNDKISIKMIMLSLFGYAWVGFGVDFILRFLALLYDPKLFQTTLFPMWIVKDNVLTWTWFYLFMFWGSFCMGYALVVNFMPRGVPNVLLRLDLFGAFQRIQIEVLDATFIIPLIAIILVNSAILAVPRSLLTPIGYISSFYILPITVAWILHFRGHPIKLRRFIYMFSGLLLYYLSPYKEHILTLFLGVLLPYILFAKHISYKKVLLSIGAVLIFAFMVTSSYRVIKWGNVGLSIKKPLLVTISNRFHGFDAMTLTVHSVPNIFPFSEHNVIKELITRIIPRALLVSKETTHRGREFSTNIWALTQSGRVVKRSSSPIAPSMPGALYSIYGLLSLTLGAFFFGCVVGFLERWIRGLGTVGSCVLITFYGIRIAGGLERDFTYAISSLIQITIVMLLIATFFPFRAEKSSI